MDPDNTVQTDSSIVLTNVSASEPEGGQGVEPDHGVPEASVHDGQMDPYEAVEPVSVPSGREHLRGGKKFIDYAITLRGILWKSERRSDFHVSE